MSISPTNASCRVAFDNQETMTNPSAFQSVFEIQLEIDREFIYTAFLHMLLVIPFELNATFQLLDTIVVSEIRNA